MKTVVTTLLFNFIFAAGVTASISDAILDFKTNHTIIVGDKILKIDFDVNGDGKNETLLVLKSDFENDKENHEPTGWSFYIRKNTLAVSFMKSSGTETNPSQINIDDIPQIDHERCFIGLIDELEKNGVVTIRYNNPREGPSIAIIYAYTIEGDHLKKTELTRYSDPTAPNALFTKYLADNKRTVVIPVEIDP
jgi:hypothetical protein